MPTPEQRVRKEVRYFLENRGWKLFLTHGNKFQKGFPDAYALHPQYGARWIDFKVSGKYSFTLAQKNTWCDWYFNFNTGVYILTGGNQGEYDKLFKPCNFLDYWKNSWGSPEEFARPLDPADLTETLLGDWRPIKDFSTYYVSDDGRVFSEYSGRLLTPEICCSGHLRVVICNRKSKRRVFIHTLVLETFVGLCPDKLQCRHKDGQPNNNRLENLVWGSAKENALDRSKHGRHPTSKLSKDDVHEIINSSASVTELSQQFNVVEHTIYDILRGKTWEWVTGIKCKEPRRKLKRDEIIAIFKCEGSQREIAAKFNTHHTTVGAIKRRQSNKDITEGL